MIVGQIKDGIVLDHISAGNGMNIYNVLHLDKLDCTVALIKNADSAKMGKKDIIKIGRLQEGTLRLRQKIPEGSFRQCFEKVR